MKEIPGLETDLRDIPTHSRVEIPEAFERALHAGAKPPLEYVGSGMFGIVFCDQEGHAWEVMRLEPAESSTIGVERERLFQLENVADEYEWLRDAARTPIAKNVAEVYAIHPDELVLERECVEGRTGGWSEGKK